MAKRLCWNLDTLAFPIKLEQVGPDNFTVTYGVEVTSRLTYAQASSSLGSAVVHALACEGRLNTIARGLV